MLYVFLQEYEIFQPRIITHSTVSWMKLLHEVDKAVRKHPTLTRVQVANSELVDYLACDNSEFSWKKTRWDSG